MQHFPDYAYAASRGWSSALPDSLQDPAGTMSEGLVKQEEVPTRIQRKENLNGECAEWNNSGVAHQLSILIEINVPSTLTKVWSTPPD